MTSSSPTIEPIYAVDTHSLLWYMTDQRKLSPQARAIFPITKDGSIRDSRLVRVAW